ncbi:MAG: CBS domain-containing protein [Chloroflexota bacterium]|nr:CBS domain-containing protein [Chloroflexota bacterium]
MQVREIMSSPVITVGPEMKIQTLARTMREHQISGVPVVDEDGKLLGTVTELNLIARNAPLKQPQYLAVLSALIPIGVENYFEYKDQLRQALATNAGELMNSEVRTIEPTATVQEALEIMLDPANNLLPVIKDEQVIGVVTRTDLVRLIEQLEMAPDEGSDAA